MRALSMRLIWPAPTPSVMPSLQNTMAFDLTYFATFQANSRSSSCAAVGCFFVATFSSPRASSRLSALWTSRPQPTRFASCALRPRSHAVPPSRFTPPSGICSTRMLAFAAKISSASSL